MRLLFILLLVVGSKSVLIAQLSLDSLKYVAIKHPDDTLKVRTYLKIYYEYHRSNIDSALVYAKKAEDLSRRLDFQSGLANSLYRQSTIYRSRSEYAKSEELLSSAKQYFEAMGDSTLLLYSTIDLARLAQLQNKNDEAISIFQIAIQVAINLNDKNSQARAENYLGQLFRDQKQFEKALEHYQYALELVTVINFLPGVTACLTNMSEIYIAQKNHEKAFEYLNKALELKRKMGDKLGTSRVLLNLAATHDDLAEYEKAKPYYLEAYNLAGELGQKEQLSLSAYGLAQNSYNLKQYQQALQYSQEVTRLVEQTRNLSLAVSNTKLQGFIQAGLGDFEKSYELFSTHSTLNDSLYDETKLALINELEEKYQNEQKAKEIVLLESENQLQSLQIAKRESERNYLIAFAIVALILIALGYNQYRIKQRSNEKLKELDRMKTSFFENLSHEFRTPLSLIMAPIKDRMETANNEDKKELGLIYKNAQRLLTMINELLDLAKLEAGGYQINKSSAEITQIFKILEASYSSLAASKSIAFDVVVPKEQIWLKTDQKALNQICHNLLTNAFKFTPEGGEVTIEIKYSSKALTVRVTDSGKGISEADQKRIFNRFEQASSDNSQGTGIGLALVRELVETQGGSIDLKSEPGKGSVFSITIPAEVGEVLENTEEAFEEIEIDEYAASTGEPYLGQQMKLLIVEDNKELRHYMSNLLGKSYQIITAKNGVEGLHMATTEVPDLILSDVMMPEMDGLEFCQKLHEQVATDHIPIILLTARADSETKLSGLRHGAIQYITKPFEPDELKITIENLIRQQVKLREKYRTGDDITQESKIHPFLVSCEEIVEKHLDDSTFDMTQFAKEVGMSRMQLHRKLNSLTNLSSTAFIRYHRLNKAKQLLESGEHVSQVAYAVGFSSLSYFSTSFKKQFGKSPSEFTTAS